MFPLGCCERSHHRVDVSRSVPLLSGRFDAVATIGPLEKPGSASRDFCEVNRQLFVAGRKRSVRRVLPSRFGRIADGRDRSARRILGPNVTAFLR